MDKGAQSQHLSNSLSTHFPSQPTAEPVPQHPGHPRTSGAAGQVTFLPGGALAAGEASSAYLLSG